MRHSDLQHDSQIVVDIHGIIIERIQYLGPISFEANDVRGPIPDKAYTVPMKTSLVIIVMKIVSNSNQCMYDMSVFVCDVNVCDYVHLRTALKISKLLLTSSFLSPPCWFWSFTYSIYLLPFASG